MHLFAEHGIVRSDSFWLEPFTKLNSVICTIFTYFLCKIYLIWMKYVMLHYSVYSCLWEYTFGFKFVLWYLNCDGIINPLCALMPAWFWVKSRSHMTLDVVSREDMQWQSFFFFRTSCTEKSEQVWDMILVTFWHMFTLSFKLLQTDPNEIGNMFSNFTDSNSYIFADKFFS